MRFLFFVVIMSSLISSCMQIHADRDQISTIPTTNNPQIIPSHHSQTPVN